MTEEEWRSIPGYPGYEASSDGHIRRWATTTWRVLRQYTVHGYRKVSVKVSGKHKNVPVHRLVALTYYGQPGRGQTLVRHLNGDPTDNRAANLKWGTHVENTQ